MADDVLAALAAHPPHASVLELLAARDDVRVVGGAVRDALLGRIPRDLDLVVEGDGAALAAQLGAVEETHERFGTASVRVGDAVVNVASARGETYAAPGALPDVAPAGFDEDLRRRDFTVNAMAVDMAGRLHAVEGASDDLAAGRLRVLHSGSFADDPTRLWRAARYLARLRFGLEEATEQLAREALRSGALDTVSGARLGTELRLALGEADPVAALGAANELGLLPAGMSARRGLARAALELLPADGHPGTTVLAAFAGAVALDALRSWLDDLAVPARERDTLVGAVTAAERLRAALDAARRPSEIAAAVRGHGVEAVALAGALGPAETARSWLEDLRTVRLDIGGADLLAAGVHTGPEVGERLARALAARLDGDAPDRDSQLAVALA